MSGPAQGRQTPGTDGQGPRPALDPVDAVMRLLLRLLLVPLGYFCAVLAGSSVIAIGEWRVDELFRIEQQDALVVGAMMAIVASMTLLMVLLSFMWLVAAVGILFSELFAVRSWMFHAANGMVSAWIGAQLIESPPGSGFTVNGQTMADNAAQMAMVAPLTIIAAGLAGGLVYWLVAGSSAGFFKPVLRSPASRLGHEETDGRSPGMPSAGAQPDVAPQKGANTPEKP